MFPLAAVETYVPAGHPEVDTDPLIHTVAPAEEYSPALQLAQPDDLVTPVAELNLPAAHAMHDACPTSYTYLPAPHAVHDTAPSPAPALVRLPAAHEMHANNPAAFPYLPVAHFEQLLAPAPAKEPREQTPQEVPAFTPDFAKPATH